MCTGCSRAPRRPPRPPPPPRADAARAAELRASEARLRRVADAGVVGLFFWTLEGGIYEANDAFLAMLGFSRDDLAAGRVDWRRLTPPEYAAEDAERVAELLATGAHGPYEKAYVGKDGRAVPVLLASAFFDAAAEAARREQEREFAAVADHIPQLAWMAGPDGAIFWYNARWYAYTGTTPEAMRGWGWRAVHHPDHVERVTARFRAAVAAGEPWEDTFPLRSAAGEWRWFLSRALPIRDDVGGEVTRWFGTNTDVTTQCAAAAERERLLASERLARDAAEQANRAKSSFLATMSHELRTPLNAIRGYADLLAMGLYGPVTPEQRDAVTRITTSERHLLGIIDDVLDFARLEAGRVAIALGPVDVARVVGEEEALVAPQAARKGVEIAADLDAGAWCVRADAERVRQILANLLSNAIKFTDAGGRVTVDVAGAGELVSVRVRDTGVGIAADRLDEVFAPFAQVEPALTRTKGGVGLGLPISRALARAMRGDLTATSVVGEGSTFTLTLPQERPHDAAPVGPHDAGA